MKEIELKHLRILQCLGEDAEAFEVLCSGERMKAELSNEHLEHPALMRKSYKFFSKLDLLEGLLI